MEKIKNFLKKSIYKKFKVWHLLIILIIIGAGGEGGEAGNERGEAGNEGANQDCLVGFDWGYPTPSNSTSAWRFEDNGTFSFSTMGFGGMSSRGNWYISSNKVHITYTWSSGGMSLPDQTLTLSNCNTLMVGSTNYKKN